MTARDDPRWLQARHDYVRDRDDEDPDSAFFERIKAAWRMREIEREYETAENEPA